VDPRLADASAIRHRPLPERPRPWTRPARDGAGTVRDVAEDQQVGRVEQIWIYPVRSLAGRSADACEVGTGGLAGDRAWTVVDADEQVVRAKDVPAMRDVAATGDPAVDEDRLSAALDRPVHLVATPATGTGVAPVHLVSRQAVDRAAAGDVPEGCSPEDPRANLLLTLDGDDERSWVGRTVRVGDAVLAVTRTPKHCLGVYADVRRPGVVHVGDPVLLE
jgi:uncharacterized protein